MKDHRSRSASRTTFPVDEVIFDDHKMGRKSFSREKTNVENLEDYHCLSTPSVTCSAEEEIFDHHKMCRKSFRSEEESGEVLKDYRDRRASITMYPDDELKFDYHSMGRVSVRREENHVDDLKEHRIRNTTRIACPVDEEIFDHHIVDRKSFSLKPHETGNLVNLKSDPAVARKSVSLKYHVEENLDDLKRRRLSRSECATKQESLSDRSSSLNSIILEPVTTAALASEASRHSVSVNYQEKETLHTLMPSGASWRHDCMRDKLDDQSLSQHSTLEMLETSLSDIPVYFSLCAEYKKKCSGHLKESFAPNKDDFLQDQLDDQSVNQISIISEETPQTPLSNAQSSSAGVSHGEEGALEDLGVRCASRRDVPVDHKDLKPRRISSLSRVVKPKPCRTSKPLEDQKGRRLSSRSACLVEDVYDDHNSRRQLTEGQYGATSRLTDCLVGRGSIRNRQESLEDSVYQRETIKRTQFDGTAELANQNGERQSVIDREATPCLSPNYTVGLNCVRAAASSDEHIEDFPKQRTSTREQDVMENKRAGWPLFANYDRHQDTLSDSHKRHTLRRDGLGSEQIIDIDKQNRLNQSSTIRDVETKSRFSDYADLEISVSRRDKGSSLEEAHRRESFKRTTHSASDERTRWRSTIRQPSREVRQSSQSRDAQRSSSNARYHDVDEDEDAWERRAPGYNYHDEGTSLDDDPRQIATAGTADPLSPAARPEDASQSLLLQSPAKPTHSSGNLHVDPCADSRDSRWSASDESCVRDHAQEQMLSGGTAPNNKLDGNLSQRQSMHNEREPTPNPDAWSALYGGSSDNGFLRQDISCTESCSNSYGKTRRAMDGGNGEESRHHIEGGLLTRRSTRTNAAPPGVEEQETTCALIQENSTQVNNMKGCTATDDDDVDNSPSLQSSRHSRVASTRRPSRGAEGVAIRLRRSARNLRDRSDGRPSYIAEETVCRPPDIAHMRPSQNTGTRRYIAERPQRRRRASLSEQRTGTSQSVTGYDLRDTSSLLSRSTTHKSNSIQQQCQAENDLEIRSAFPTSTGSGRSASHRFLTRTCCDKHYSSDIDSNLRKGKNAAFLHRESLPPSVITKSRWRANTHTSISLQSDLTEGATVISDDESSVRGVLVQQTGHSECWVDVDRASSITSMDMAPADVSEGMPRTDKPKAYTPPSLRVCGRSSSLHIDHSGLHFPQKARSCAFPDWHKVIVPIRPVTLPARLLSQEANLDSLQFNCTANGPFAQVFINHPLVLGTWQSAGMDLLAHLKSRDLSVDEVERVAQEVMERPSAFLRLWTAYDDGIAVNFICGNAKRSSILPLFATKITAVISPDSVQALENIPMAQGPEFSLGHTQAVARSIAQQMDEHQGRMQAWLNALENPKTGGGRDPASLRRAYTMPAASQRESCARRSIVKSLDISAHLLSDMAPLPQPSWKETSTSLAVKENNGSEENTYVTGSSRSANMQSDEHAREDRRMNAAGRQSSLWMSALGIHKLLQSTTLEGEDIRASSALARDDNQTSSAFEHGDDNGSGNRSDHSGAILYSSELTPRGSQRDGRCESRPESPIPSDAGRRSSCSDDVSRGGHLPASTIRQPTIEVPRTFRSDALPDATFVVHESFHHKAPNFSPQSSGSVGRPFLVFPNAAEPTSRTAPINPAGMSMDATELERSTPSASHSPNTDATDCVFRNFHYPSTPGRDIGGVSSTGALEAFADDGSVGELALRVVSKSSRSKQPPRPSTYPSAPSSMSVRSAQDDHLMPEGMHGTPLSERSSIPPTSACARSTSWCGSSYISHWSSEQRASTGAEQHSQFSTPRPKASRSSPLRSISMLRSRVRADEHRPPSSAYTYLTSDLTSRCEIPSLLSSMSNLSPTVDQSNQSSPLDSHRDASSWPTQESALLGSGDVTADSRTVSSPSTDRNQGTMHSFQASSTSQFSHVTYRSHDHTGSSQPSSSSQPTSHTYDLSYRSAHHHASSKSASLLHNKLSNYGDSSSSFTQSTPNTESLSDDRDSIFTKSRTSDLSKSFGLSASSSFIKSTPSSALTSQSAISHQKSDPFRMATHRSVVSLSKISESVSSASLVSSRSANADRLLNPKASSRDDRHSDKSSSSLGSSVTDKNERIDDRSLNSCMSENSRGSHPSSSATDSKLLASSSSSSSPDVSSSVVSPSTASFASAKSAASSGIALVSGQSSNMREESESDIVNVSRTVSGHYYVQQPGHMVCESVEHWDEVDRAEQALREGKFPKDFWTIVKRCTEGKRLGDTGVVRLLIALMHRLFRHDDTEEPPRAWWAPFPELSSDILTHSECLTTRLDNMPTDDCLALQVLGQYILHIPRKQWNLPTGVTDIILRRFSVVLDSFEKHPTQATLREIKAFIDLFHQLRPILPNEAPVMVDFSKRDQRRAALCGQHFWLGYIPVASLVTVCPKAAEHSWAEMAKQCVKLLQFALRHHDDIALRLTSHGICSIIQGNLCMNVGWSVMDFLEWKTELKKHLLDTRFLINISKVPSRDITPLKRKINQLFNGTYKGPDYDDSPHRGHKLTNG
eukprot:GEMP01000262.1.p1 GENE.GEMP01000262.1~~GEMP01000262.1.p1  ORF type:complete len:2530 (+),score=389.63 GEMP01000262.1:1-7590(+)